VAVQAGYNWRPPSGLLLGVEADLTFPNYLPSNSITSFLVSPRSYVSRNGIISAPRAAASAYTSGPWLAYVTGGLAYAGERFINMPTVGSDEKHIGHRLGWAAGAGVDMVLRRIGVCGWNISTASSKRANVIFPSGTQYASTLDFQQLRIGLNRKGRPAGPADLDAEE